MEQLKRILEELNLVPVFSDYLYAKDSVKSGTPQERAEALMGFFRDPEIAVIFDVSGGDIANELLPYLDFEAIAASRAVFCGYSDLTTIMNGIYAKTGKHSVWYQAKHLTGRDGERQRRMLSQVLEAVRGNLNAPERSPEAAKSSLELFQPVFETVQGHVVKGAVVGGNIRCLLKLAGTPYWPPMQGKLLFLEARGGSLPQMTAYVNQLKQMGVFEQVSGILLGTFLQMEKEGISMTDLVIQCAGKRLFIARTRELGHRADSKALVLGRELCIMEEKAVL